MRISNCGKYSEKLSKILSNIEKETKASGKEFNSIDENSADIALFNAYNKIMAYSKDDNDLASGMNSLEILMNNGAAISDIESVTSAAIKFMLIEKERIDDNQLGDINANNVATAAMIGLLMAKTPEYQSIQMNISAYSKETVNYIDSLYEQMSNENIDVEANVDVQGKLVAVEKLSSVVQQYCSGAPTKMNNKAVLGWIGRALEYEDEGMDKVILDNLQLLAESKLEGLEIDFSKFRTPDGKLDRTSSRDYIEKAIGVHNFGKINERAANSAIQKGKKPHKNFETYLKSEEERVNVIKLVKTAVEDINLGRKDKLKALLEENPEIAKKGLIGLLDLQQGVKSPKALQNLQKICLSIGEVFPEIMKEHENRGNNNREQQNLIDTERER